MMSERSVSDEARGSDSVHVSRYEGTQAIRQLIRNDELLKAVTLAFQILDRELANSRVRIAADPQAQMEERLAIEDEMRRRNGKSPPLHSTIQSAYERGAITGDEYEFLNKCRNVRNDFIHCPGHWHPAAGQRRTVSEMLVELLEFLDEHADT